MEKIKRKDIKEIETFEKFGEIFTKIYKDDEIHVYVYERRKNGGTSGGFEVIRGKKYTNPDGSVVYCYPSSEDFGVYGYYISALMRDCKERIQKYIEKLSKDEE